jgi:hypothetical protein
MYTGSRTRTLFMLLVMPKVVDRSYAQAVKSRLIVWREVV